MEGSNPQAEVNEQTSSKPGAQITRIRIRPSQSGWCGGLYIRTKAVAHARRSHCYKSRPMSNPFRSEVPGICDPSIAVRARHRDSPTKSSTTGPRPPETLARKHAAPALFPAQIARQQARRGRAGSVERNVRNLGSSPPVPRRLRWRPSPPWGRRPMTQRSQPQLKGTQIHPLRRSGPE